MRFSSFRWCILSFRFLRSFGGSGQNLSVCLPSPCFSEEKCIAYRRIILCCDFGNEPMAYRWQLRVVWCYFVLDYLATHFLLVEASQLQDLPTSPRLLLLRWAYQLIPCLNSKVLAEEPFEVPQKFRSRAPAAIYVAPVVVHRPCPVAPQ